MPEGLWVVIGALVTGGFLISAQVLSQRSQAHAARDAWNRSQLAQQRGELESTCLAILRFVHQIENAVLSWEDGTLMSTQAHGSIGAGARSLEDSGLGIVLRNGPKDPIVGFMGRLIRSANRYAELKRPGWVPTPTAKEVAAQVDDVKSAAEALRDYLHRMLREETKAQ
jgi:hypothetical protein